MLVSLVAVAALVAGCTEDPPKQGYDPDPKALHIVAGSEQQAVLEQVVKPWCEAKQ